MERKEYRDKYNKIYGKESFMENEKVVVSEDGEGYRKGHKENKELLGRERSEVYERTRGRASIDVKVGMINFKVAVGKD